MATQTAAPGPNVNHAPELLGITGALYIVALLLWGTRMYSRLRPTPMLGWDDYTITLGIVSRPLPTSAHVFKTLMNPERS